MTGLLRTIKLMGNRLVLAWRRWMLITTHCPHCMLARDEAQLIGHCPFSECAFGLPRRPEVFRAKWPKDNRLMGDQP
jgi:hypothetical protein